MLWLNTEQIKSIQDHAQRGFPNEICGILLGDVQAAPGGLPQEAVRTVREVIPAENLNKERAVDRYDLDPQEQIRAEKRARQKGWEVLGFYHSHPDHPCRASRTDFERSWEAYSYLIVSVMAGKVIARACWIRSPEDRNDYFVEEEIKVG